MLHHWIDEEEEDEEERLEHRARKIQEYIDEMPMFGPKPVDFDYHGNPIW